MARTYDNRARADAALDTRRRILRTAHALLVERGYPAFTIKALAEAAAVSPQTVYNSIGGKAEVLKAAYDVAMVGDDDPVPMSLRPEFVRLGAAGTVAEWTEAYAAYVSGIYLRVGDLIGAVLRPGEGLDRGAGEFAATIDRERRIGTTHAVTAFARIAGRDPAAVEPFADAVWTLNAPEVYDRLVRRSGWPVADYTRWLAGQLAASAAALAGPGGLG